MATTNHFIQELSHCHPNAEITVRLSGQKYGFQGRAGHVVHEWQAMADQLAEAQAEAEKWKALALKLAAAV
jgi:rRNA maturation protein Rpf1